MQVSGPLKEDTVTVPKIAAVERREGARAGHTACGRLREVPSCDLRRSGAPLPHHVRGKTRKAPPRATARGRWIMPACLRTDARDAVLRTAMRRLFET